MISTTAFFIGNEGFTYQPRTKSNGKGIKWLPEVKRDTPVKKDEKKRA